MTDAHFHLFVYGTLRKGERSEHLLGDSEWIGPAEVGGILYDIDGAHPALVLYGTTPVKGEVWKCPSALLQKLDEYEELSTGLMRRVGVTAHAGCQAIPCWVYVAGPRLTRKLTPARRILQGQWGKASMGAHES
jgi:gamma-glutamylcyclotransferase (GGCT)/AIG2-like uncharacterized protein YtfP